MVKRFFQTGLACPQAADQEGRQKMHLLFREMRPFVFSLAMLVIALGTAISENFDIEKEWLGVRRPI